MQPTVFLWEVGGVSPTVLLHSLVHLSHALEPRLSVDYVGRGYEDAEVVLGSEPAKRRHLKGKSSLNYFTRLSYFHSLVVR